MRLVGEATRSNSMADAGLYALGIIKNSLVVDGAGRFTEAKAVETRDSQ